ncbi:MAG: TolC family protein [Ignavibacteria bacterium]|nr:TolC family protein [Ignavibacteria bacterium]
MEDGKWMMENGNSNFLIAVFLFFLLLFTNAKAQTLDSLINEALQNNSKLKSLQYKIISSEKRSESINVLPPPNLSVEFSQVPISSIDILNQSNSNNFSLSQMLPLGKKLNAMAEVERRNKIIESDNYEIYKTNLIAMIKISYYSLWLMDRKIEIQRKSISLLNDLISSIEPAYYTNKINQADLLSIKSEIELNKTQLLILEKQREAELYNMNKLLGRNLSSKDLNVLAEIELPSIDFIQNRLEEFLTEANPTLKKMNSMISMNEAMIEANNRELIPDLMIQGMFMRMPKGMYLTSKNYLSMINPQTEIMYSLMFSINLPFAPWSIKKYKAKEEELYAGIKSLEFDKIDMLREISAELKSSLVKYQTAIELVNLYNEKVIPLYKQTAESQLIAYQNNKTDITTVIESYRMMLMQQMNLLMAKADAQMALTEIERLIDARWIRDNG